MSEYFNGSSAVSRPFLAESLHIHPGYKTQDYNNDIALIKLNSSITFSTNVMPVCLPPQDAALETSG